MPDPEGVAACDELIVCDGVKVPERVWLDVDDCDEDVEGVSAPLAVPDTEGLAEPLRVLDCDLELV